MRFVKIMKQGHNKNWNMEGNEQMIKNMKQYEESNDEERGSIYK